MIDTGTLLFSLFLILVGLKLVSFVRSGLARGEQDGVDEHDLRQQTARTLRQMERQRGRIWWKMDEVYAEFVRKSAIETRPTRLLPEKAITQENELTLSGEDEEFALTELQTAYEVFLGKDSPLANNANYAASSSNQFEPTAR
jgi:hypothetical protein